MNGFPAHWPAELIERLRYQRHLRYTDLPPAPPKHCLWCGQPVAGRRQCWCGPECIAEYLIRGSEQSARRAVWKRDRGVCAVCAYDCGDPTWEADHIIPVVEGGGCCGLDNYRTLCPPCHKLDTAELAARLAQRRREAQGRPVQETLDITPDPQPDRPVRVNVGGPGGACA
jgi:5-methylcytosine-specific restriction protein A